MNEEMTDCLLERTEKNCSNFSLIRSREEGAKVKSFQMGAMSVVKRRKTIGIRFDKKGKVVGEDGKKTCIK